MTSSIAPALFSVLLTLTACAQPAPRLIVRGDDMGYAHAGNEAIMKTYTDGIVTSVEVIVPSPWFPEAVRMLADHPGLDMPELRAIHHIGYEEVALDRQGVTDLWTDPGIREIIEALGIELIGYDDL